MKQALVFGYLLGWPWLTVVFLQCVKFAKFNWANLHSLFFGLQKADFSECLGFKQIAHESGQPFRSWA